MPSLELQTKYFSFLRNSPMNGTFWGTVRSEILCSSKLHSKYLRTQKQHQRQNSLERKRNPTKEYSTVYRKSCLFHEMRSKKYYWITIYDSRVFPEFWPFFFGIPEYFPVFNKILRIPEFFPVFPNSRVEWPPWYMHHWQRIEDILDSSKFLTRMVSSIYR